MYFSLMNSPPMFCWAMAYIFWHLLAKYPDNFFVYMDNLLIATNGDVDFHWHIIDQVLKTPTWESYFLQPAKCEFERTHIEYLGLIVDGDKLTMDPKKVDGLHNWPQTLKMVKEVCSILGVLVYQQPFIQNYANITWPLMALTKKDHPFIWTLECCTALDTLINIILNNPSLRQPDLLKPFFLQVDALAFATATILTQKDGRNKHVTVGFHSQTFHNAERNYNIHDHELLAVYQGLTHNCHLLLSSPHPIMVLTDHKNLEYYQKPQNINWRVARYIPHLANYNFTLVHIPGPTNKADTLSHWPNYNDGPKDNTDVIVLPPHLFTCAITLSSLACVCQLQQQHLLTHWVTTFSLKKVTFIAMVIN